MGQIVVTEFLTLDGVAQAPGQPDEDREGNFAHGGWMAPVSDAEAGPLIFEAASTMDALLLGRKTYEIFADYWPNAPDDVPFTGLLNGVPKYVASRSLAAPLTWSGSTLLDREVAEQVTAIKESHREIHVIGSLEFVQSLLTWRLVDRLDLWLYPVVLGHGKRLFGGGTVPANLRLVDSATFASGALHLVYETAGLPTYGTIGAG